MQNEDAVLAAEEALELKIRFEEQTKEAKELYQAGDFVELRERVNFLFESSFCATQNFFISKNTDGALTDMTEIGGRKFYEALSLESDVFRQAKTREMLDCIKSPNQFLISLFSPLAKMNYLKFLEVLTKNILAQPTFIVLLEEHEIISPQNPTKVSIEDVIEAVLRYIKSDFTKPIKHEIAELDEDIPPQLGGGIHAL